MERKNTEILNSFIKAPELKIHSEIYPFQNFNFSKEEITDHKFQFPKNSIIGVQAEACFEAYLIYSKHYKLLISNLQIEGERETLGELDYIVQDLTTNEVVHIELACKFYLYDGKADVSEEEKWIGPNRKDSLYDKLEKLKTKQFSLISSKRTIQKLESLEVNIPTSQELCFKAFLFVPKKTNLDIFPINFKHCIVGYWISQSDFENEDHDAVYAIPNKKQWLLPWNYITTWFSFSEIKLEIKTHIEKERSPLIYKKTSIKIERFFVVWW